MKKNNPTRGQSGRAGDFTKGQIKQSNPTKSPAQNPAPPPCPVVYHFTDTRHLPGIVECGELHPSQEYLWLGRPFLWGTTNPAGDKTASPFRPTTSPDRILGHTRMIRFTFPGEVFLTWEETRRMVAATPAWRQRSGERRSRRASISAST